ncbi:MAG: phosphoribosylamine---glycine ligase [Frankiales bacterium]|nr:phosphoribosylamine---glycine ligase [Frankiales bacterium]
MFVTVIAMTSLRVLVVGAGAREHALCVALRRDPSVAALACAPGNAGTAAVADSFPLDVTDPAAVAALGVDWQADLVVIGPELPLVAGAADACRARGLAVFGPSAAAAEIEGSKAFAKDVMTAAGVPTAGHWVCEGDAAEVLATLQPPYVVKHDGLAAGKGVVVTADLDEAVAHAAGERVVIEEYLDGPEVSLFAVTDGVTVVPLEPAQDFKRALDGDAGPNTGGMGAYSPLPWAPEGLVDEVLRTVLQPTVDELRRRGTPFSGLLYAGLALTAKGIRVIEFNARFGDPETQVVLARLRTPLAGLLLAAATGTLADHLALDWSDQSAVTVVIAAHDYPGTPRMGDEITGLPAAQRISGVDVLHAGTRTVDGKVVSAGGRVLSVTAVGADLSVARARAYEAVDLIGLAGSHHRRDIAAAAAAGDVHLS